MENQRGWKTAYAYAEYVSACKEAGERPYAYSSFCVGLREWRRDMAEKDLPEWYPGEYVKTYWSKGSAIVAGKSVAFPVFVAVMAYSDATFVCRSEGMSTPDWMECCQKAFKWLGGVPYVTDCMQSKASITAHSTLEAFARHYRTVLYGARPKTEKSAGGGEKPLDARNFSYVAKHVIADIAVMDFDDLQDLDGYIEQKLKTYNNIASKGRTARWRLFKERELPQMLELPAKDADFAKWSTRIVADDYHFIIDWVRYSVPWRHANEAVRVSWTEDEVRAYSNGELIARHKRMLEPKGRCTVTDPAHRPPGHRWFANRMDDRFLTLAKAEGGYVVRVMKRLLKACKREGKGFRACKELLDLAKLPSGLTLNEACAAVLADGGAADVPAVRLKMNGGAL